MHKRRNRLGILAVFRIDRIRRSQVPPIGFLRRGKSLLVGGEDGGDGRVWRGQHDGRLAGTCGQEQGGSDHEGESCGSRELWHPATVRQGHGGGCDFSTR